MSRLAAMSDAASTKSASPARTTSSAGSKRKRGTEPKFYSVRAGHKPGIYLSWAECLAQIKGFKGAMFKSFTSLVDAEKFLAGDDPTNDPASSTYQPKFYGVKNGRVPGVYTDWPSAQKQIIGWTKPKHKCFTSRAEAEAYVKSGDETRSTNGASSSTPEAQRTTESSTRDSPDEVNGTAKKQKRTGPTISNLLGGHNAKFAGDADSNSEDSQDAGDHHPDLDDRLPKPESPRKGKPKATPQKRGGVLRIYTDGSSLGNGKFGATAGVGVYFGEDDERNVSEPLAGPRQTNQRAELTAILRAIEIAPIHREVRIFTDSSYSIDCVTKWYVNWRRNNWRTSLGKPVENQDLVEAILEKIEERNKVGVKTTFEWIKGHAATEGNIKADLLAVNGAKSARV